MISMIKKLFMNKVGTTVPDQLKKKIDTENQEKLEQDRLKKEEKELEQEADRQHVEAASKKLEPIKNAIAEISEELIGNPHIRFTIEDASLTGHFGNIHFYAYWSTLVRPNQYSIVIGYDDPRNQGDHFNSDREFVDGLFKGADAVIDLLMDVIAVVVTHDGTISKDQIVNLVAKHSEFTKPFATF